MAELTDRFNPDPDAPYGKCLTCEEAGTELTFADRDAMQAHMHETFEASNHANGHRTRTTNPTRQERITSSVMSSAQDAADSALTEFVDDVARLLDRGDATLAELTAAVAESTMFVDLDWHEAWREYKTENELDERVEGEVPAHQPRQIDTLPGMEVPNG